MLNAKANQSTTHTNTEVDTSLNAQANPSTTDTKTEVDTAVAAQANEPATDTKTEVDTAVVAEANQSTAYTKTEVDTADSAKQPLITTTSCILNCTFAAGTLTAHHVPTKFILPPLGNMGLQLQAIACTVGTLVFLIATSSAIEVWSFLVLINI